MTVDLMRRRDRPAQIARRFAARLTRALPLDEVLVQLAEIARLGTAADAVEVWVAEPEPTVGELTFALGAAVPGVALDPLVVSGAERDVLVSGVPRGPAWLAVWLPAVAERLAGAPARLAPMVHRGQVLGLLVATRTAGASSFGDRDDLVLADLARQTAVALHNSQLDSALADTVARLRESNVELRRSRARLVAAAEAERRRLERDLHDGAQQHLVAISVKVLLARQAIESGRPDAALALLDELKADATLALEELRTLAHGLYPNELAAGLGEALGVIAARSPLPVELVVATGSRYPGSIETCCYFCCAEAVANAAKHAGPGATGVRIELAEHDGALVLDVSDDGVGFAPQVAAGHGLENLVDRAGVLGGDVAFRQATPHGARVTVRLPLSAPTFPPTAASDVNGRRADRS